MPAQDDDAPWAGICRPLGLYPGQSMTRDINTITPPRHRESEETERWAGAVALRAMPTLGAKNAPKMGHPDCLGCDISLVGA